MSSFEEHESRLDSIERILVSRTFAQEALGPRVDSLESRVSRLSDENARLLQRLDSLERQLQETRIQTYMLERLFTSTNPNKRARNN